MLYKSIIENNTSIYPIFFPTSITIKLTNRCNLNCSFCSQGDARNVDLDLKTIKKLLDEIKGYSVCEVIYTGGEPLLHPHINEILMYGKRLGLHQILVTNGMNLDCFTTDIFSVIESIGISIHGDETVHDAVVGHKGAYKKVVSNIDFIHRMKNGPSITLNFTISERNTNCISSVQDLAKMYGCQMCVARLNKIGRAEKNENIKEIIDLFFCQLQEDNMIKVSNVIPTCQVRKKYRYLCHGCSAGIASVCIEADASVKICASSNQSYGSINQNSLYEIWNNKEFTEFRSLKWLPDLCKNCRDFTQCLGGCKAEISDHPLTYSKDCLVSQAIEIFFKDCKDKKMILCFDHIRRINHDYLLVGRPNRIIDEEGFLMIKTLMKTEQIESFLKGLKESKKKEVMEFLYAMFKDGLLILK